GEARAHRASHRAAWVRRSRRELGAGGGRVVRTTHNMEEVEEVCDRVAILCRGRLAALDTPLALRRRHAERKVDVVLTDGGRHVFDLDCDNERAGLGRRVAAGEVACMQTREFNFHEAFLKLTGTVFN